MLAIPGDETMEREPLTTWEAIENAYRTDFREPNVRWLFRGQRESPEPDEKSRQLRPSLERVLEDRFQRPLAEAPVIEKRLLREFKRHLHRYTTDVPDEDDNLRWLALMQHHGAPTRLLDFTYSFLVAVFFSIERAKHNDRCAVWAIDHNWLWLAVRESLPPDLVSSLDDARQSKTPETMRALFATPKDILVTLNPMNLDERLAVQQGVFVCSLDLTKRFADVARGLARSEEEYDAHVRRVEIRCSAELLREAIRELQRMNITRLSLFPGIDGLAQSLENAIELSTLSRYGDTDSQVLDG